MAQDNLSTQHLKRDPNDPRLTPNATVGFTLTDVAEPAVELAKVRHEDQPDGSTTHVGVDQNDPR